MADRRQSASRASHATFSRRQLRATFPRLFPFNKAEVIGIAGAQSH